MPDGRRRRARSALIYAVLPAYPPTSARKGRRLAPQSPPALIWTRLSSMIPATFDRDVALNLDSVFPVPVPPPRLLRRSDPGSIRMCRASLTAGSGRTVSHGDAQETQKSTVFRAPQHPRGRVQSQTCGKLFFEILFLNSAVITVLRYGDGPQEMSCVGAAKSLNTAVRHGVYSQRQQLLSSRLRRRLVMATVRCSFDGCHAARHYQRFR